MRRGHLSRDPHNVNKDSVMIWENRVPGRGRHRAKAASWWKLGAFKEQKEGHAGVCC